MVSVGASDGKQASVPSAAGLPDASLCISREALADSASLGSLSGPAGGALTLAPTRCARPSEGATSLARVGSGSRADARLQFCPPRL